MRSREFLVAAICLVLAPACKRAEGPKLPPARGEGAAPLPTLPAIAGSDEGTTVAPSEGRTTGTTYPRAEAQIGPNGGGVIAKILVKEGDRVRRGAVLFRQDPRDAGLRVSQAKAALESAKVNLRATETEHQRTKAMFDQKAVNQMQWDQIQSRLDGARVGVQQAQVMLDMASKGLADATVRSPIDGVVTAKLKSEGEMATMMPPTIVLVVQDQSVLELRFRLPERALAEVKIGDTVTATFEALGLTRAAKVVRIQSTVDARSRTVEVVADLPNPEGTLKSGLLATVALSGAASAPAVAKPIGKVPTTGGAMKLADISIRRPVFAIMLIASLLVFGVVSYPRIGVDLFPNVEFPFVTVTVVYPGGDPASMESKVADPIEEALNTMSGIKVLKSINVESVSQILIQFELEVKVDAAVQDVRDRVSATMRKLPAGIDPPVVQKFDVGAAPVMSVALSGNLPVRALTKLAQDTVKTRIQRISGVGAVDLVGGRDREIHVLADPAALAGHGLTIQDLIGTLQAQNLELPAGRVELGQREFAVKTKGEVRSTKEIADILVTGLGGARIRVGDVATVEDGSAEARSHSSMNGAAAVALVIRKQSGSNTVEVAHQVHKELKALESVVQKAGARLAVPTDNAPFIEHSIEDVKFDLWFGALLAVVVIMIFLHDFRATLISALSIPTSVVATFAFVQVMGFTFNNMTMLALSLSIGILVDDAIVVIENIHRHLELGKPPLKAAADATAEIGLAVLATTFSIVAVFVPVAVMKGVIGRFFYQFGLTVSFAVLVSLLVSFTLTPMMSSRLLRLTHAERPNFIVRGFERLFAIIDGGYRRLLRAALGHRKTTLLIAALSFFGSFVLVSRVKTEFVPPEDRAMFQLTVELPSGTSLEATRKYVETIAEDLRKHGPGVTGTFVTIGGGAQAQVNIGQIQVLLVPRTTRAFHQEEAMGWVRSRYSGVKDALMSVNPISPFGGEGGFKQQPIQFNIRGTEMAEIEQAAKALVTELKKSPGIVDLDLSYRGGKPELSFDIDRDRAAELGVPVAAVATTLRALVAGDKVTELKEGLDLWDVTVQLPAEAKRGLASLDNLSVRGSTGELVPLSNIVRARRGEGPSQIDRQARQRQITVFAGLQGMPLGDALKVVNTAATKVVPASLQTDYAGMGDMMGESFGYMLVALFLAVVLVYMILAAQFDSIVHPFTIMLSLPLSVVGAFGGLFLSGMTLNIFSMIGFIMLMGLVTKNAILLVDFANHLQSQGKSVHDALMEAGPIRLRPILMTTFAMIFGMFPVALALGEGGETRAPMAVAVIGGLITSTMLTLVVVPVVYMIMSRLSSSRPVRWLGNRVTGVVPVPTDGGHVTIVHSTPPQARL